jgi:hypothetical protein
VARTAGIVLDLFARTEHHRYGPHHQHRADLYVPRDGVIAQAPITDLSACGPPAYAPMGGEPREHPERYAQCDPNGSVRRAPPRFAASGPRSTSPRDAR